MGDQEIERPYWSKFHHGWRADGNMEEYVEDVMLGGFALYMYITVHLCHDDL